MSTVGLLFVGGVAAAATGTNPLSPLLGANEDAGPSSTTTTTLGTTTTTDAPIAAAALDTEVICPDDVSNHGEAVSSVATDKSTVGAEHGAAVSDMARSDCGKTDDEENEELAPQSAPAVDDVVCPEGVSNHGEAVSTVAKDKSTVGAEHGAAVSAMAKSDCGKTDSDDDDEDESDTHESANKSSKNHGRHNDDGDDDEVEVHGS